MKLGIICPSEIAIRRFMPALKKIDGLEFVGVGINSVEERYGDDRPNQSVIDKMIESEKIKASVFIKQYGGVIYNSYESLVTSNEIEAVYIPLPPALHYKWCKLALENGKHVFVEKPSTVCAEDTRKLVSLAGKNGLALHENYMFTFHEQLNAIDQIINSGEIGDVRLYRISFGFPMRAANDFRYNKALGGGALIDAGGYTIKYAAKLLGDSARIAYAQMNGLEGFEVDMYGSAAMVNDAGVVAQLAFGMDNHYKCELEVWGSKGCLTTDRVLTAPAGFIPQVMIQNGNEKLKRDLPADDAFEKSIKRFINCITDSNIRVSNYKELVRQADLVEQFRRVAEK